MAPFLFRPVVLVQACRPLRCPSNSAPTGARVLVESTDGTRYWTTVGSSTDIIEASWLALADALEYALTVGG